MLEVDLQLHLASVVTDGELVADVTDGAAAAGLGAGGGCEGADHVVCRVVVVGTRVSHTAIIQTLISTIFFGENLKYLPSCREFIAETGSGFIRKRADDLLSQNQHSKVHPLSFSILH